MVNKKISELPAVTGIGNADLIPVMQGGATKAATVLQLLASVLGTNPPAALDTLKELADAIGDDPNYATNLVIALAGKTPVMTVAGVKTGAYTAAVNEIVPVDATASPVSIALPTSSADRTRVTVKKIDASSNAVTVTASGADVFNKTGGSTVATLTLLNQSTTVQYAAGTGVWYVVAADTPLSQLDGRYTAKTTFTVAPAVPAIRRIVSDGDVNVKAGSSANACEVRRTDQARLLLILTNNTADTLNVVEGTAGSDTIPSTGYTAVAAGSEWVTTSSLPVFAYFTTTAGLVRVYCEQGN